MKILHKVLPCRKVPISIQDAVKEELVSVTKPTEWVSQMAVAHKPNGKLRICIDPQPTVALKGHAFLRLFCWLATYLRLSCDLLAVTILHDYIIIN